MRIVRSIVGVFVSSLCIGTLAMAAPISMKAGNTSKLAPLATREAIPSEQGHHQKAFRWQQFAQNRVYRYEVPRAGRAAPTIRRAPAPRFAAPPRARAPRFAAPPRARVLRSPPRFSQPPRLRRAPSTRRRSSTVNTRRRAPRSGRRSRSRSIRRAPSYARSGYTCAACRNACFVRYRLRCGSGRACTRRFVPCMRACWRRLCR